MWIRSTLAVAGAAVLASAASAQTVIWDEAVDGNLSNDPYAGTPVGVVDGINIFRGSTLGPFVGNGQNPATPGSMSDGYDIMQIQLTDTQIIDSIFISSLVTAPGNNVGFNILRGGTVDQRLAGEPGVIQTFGGAFSPAFVGIDWLGPQFANDPVTDGTYFFEIREFGSRAEWEITFNVTTIPAPSTAGALGFFGLAATRRRRA